MKKFVYICIVFLIGLSSEAGAQDYVSGWGKTRDDALYDLSMTCVNVSSRSVTQNGEYSSVTVVDSGVVFPREAVIYEAHGDVWEARISRDLIGMTGSQWKAYESKTINYGPQHLTLGNGGVKVLRGSHTCVKEVYVVNPGGERIVVDRRYRSYRDYESWNGRYGIKGSYRVRSKYRRR